MECCRPQMHTENGTVAGAIQTLESSMLANLEDEIELTEILNCTSRVMRFTMNTGLTRIPIDYTTVENPEPNHLI